MANRNPAYWCWAMMRQRCLNPKATAFQFYGGRGIGVCDRWSSFATFLGDMGPRPSPDHSIDRVDPDGHYEPGNCRWATSAEQQANKRPGKGRRRLTHRGKTLHIAGWARRIGVTRQALWKRLQRHPLETALTMQPRKTLSHRERRTA